MKKGIIVLSLFDGMSCGRLALERAGIKIKKYYASEIDKYAQIVSAANYSDIVRLGDITKWREWNIEKPDLIIGGSPCQGFSFAGKQLNFNDPRSALFFTFVDILKYYKPKYFLLENVKMKKEYQDIISKCLGVEPIEINSALVSAQNRKRLYWTNIPNVTQPADKGIFLKDIINPHGSYSMPAIRYPESIRRTANYAQYDQTGKGHGSQDQRFFYADGKSGTVTKSHSSIPKIETEKGVVFSDIGILEKLQTVPPGYIKNVSKRAGAEMLGNGWTVDVVAHIFWGLK